MSKVRIRFAPSPTGFLHVGSLRTALFAYLIAKSLGGKFILRIEDTDQKREVSGAIEKLLDILDWLGIKFDEGTDNKGKYGSYIQSQRKEIYSKYSSELIGAGEAYYCFCSPERLQKMREDQQKKKLPPRYDGHCRNLSKAEIKKRIKAGEEYVIRQKMPQGGEVIVRDELRGDIKFRAGDLDDHVLVKSDNMPTYQLASVVDDYLMKISHVTRSEEWIPSLPKNVLLYKSFGWKPPKFIHFTSVLNKDGGKLSKRRGDATVEDYRAKGYLPEALLNFTVLLGWHPKGDNEILSLDEMIKEFSYENIGISPSVFNIEKLDYFNGHYIRHKPLAQLVELCKPFLKKYWQEKEIKEPKFLDNKYMERVVALEQERLKQLSEIGEMTEFLFSNKIDYEAELLVWKKMEKEEVKKNLEKIYELLDKIPEENWTNNSIEEATMSYIRAKELRVGEYLWPLRVALTGRKGSPGPFEVAEILGKEKSLRRIKEAGNKIANFR